MWNGLLLVVSPSNYQFWAGTPDPRYGYGAMLQGFVDSVPKSVVFDERASVDVYMGVPYTKTGWRDGAWRVLFSMWETDVLPGRFYNWLKEFDQVLVPCEHNVELFGRYHPNVSKVPLGVHETVWSPNHAERSGPYRFHAGGSLWRRKGLDTVVTAFQKLAMPNTELHIKAAPHASDTPNIKHPDIFMYRKWMSLSEQVEWFRQADCYIAASRGEGWGLMPLQAIRAGIPTIMSDSTGHQEFLNLATQTISCTKSKADTIGNWDEPNLEELIEQMRWMVLNRETAHQIAKENSPRTDQYLWRNSTRKLLQALPKGTLLDTTTFTRANPIVRVTALRPVHAYIINKTWHLTKGTEYDLPEPVYQVLSDSGAVKETK